MTLGELTDELQKYCNMGYAQEDVSIVNNSYSNWKEIVLPEFPKGIKE